MATESPDGRHHIAQLSRVRWRIAVILTTAMMVVYFGFILLVAFGKPLLGRQIVPGLSVGVLLGAGVIFTSWVLIGIYARWANRHYDVEVARVLRERARG